MVAPFRRQDYTNPADRALLNDRPISAGTTGPYAPANSDPEWYKQPFVSRLYKQPPTKDFFQQVYSADEASKSQASIAALKDKPKFSNKGDQTIASDFLDKYIKGSVLLPEEKVTPENSPVLQSQQPVEGVGDTRVVVADRIKYPGESYGIS